MQMTSLVAIQTKFKLTMLRLINVLERRHVNILEIGISQFIWSICYFNGYPSPKLEI
jgi:hypothetical protein